MRLFKAIELVLAFSLLSAWTGTATAQPAPAKGGIWQLDEEDPDHPALVFKQGEDVIFYVAGGDAVELWIAWPGLPQPEGNASVTHPRLHGEGRADQRASIHTRRRTIDLLPTDKGLSRDFNAFIDALLASKDVVVATKSGTIPMPKIDVKDAKKVRL